MGQLGQTSSSTDYSPAEFQRDCKRISQALEGGSNDASGMTSLFEGSDTSDGSVDLDEFDLDGFTKDEVNNYNSIAEPGQRLQDAVTPEKMRLLMRGASSQIRKGPGSTTPTKIPSIPKQVAMFVRKHPFLEQVAGPFAKSDRRKFERDVYDYAEALGLDHAAAKKQVIKARGFCGEETYDSDNSALGEEIDDSTDILKRLGAAAGPKTEVLPSIEDAETGQVKGPSKAKRSPKKSPYFPSSITTALPPRKRKADRDIQYSIKEKQRSEGGKRSKRRKHGDDSSEFDAAQGNESKKAQIATKKAARKAQKAQEREGSQPARDTVKSNALEPKTEAEAHENFLRSNQRDPHEHGQTLDQSKEERADNAKRDVAFVEKLRGDIRYENDKEIERYNHGNMKNERKEVKDDVENLKKAREAVEDADKHVKEKKHKKRKSGVSRTDDDRSPSNDKIGDGLINGEKHKIKAPKSAKDFF